MSAKYKGVSSLNKKILGIMLVLIVGLVAPAVALANDIGYVDFELLFYAHPEYDVKNEELQTKVEELYQEMQAQAETLQTQEELDELSSFSNGSLTKLSKRSGLSWSPLSSILSKK